MVVWGFVVVMGIWVAGCCGRDCRKGLSGFWRTVWGVDPSREGVLCSIRRDGVKTFGNSDSGGG